MTTKQSPRNAARSTEYEENDSRLTILLPELLILRLIARSVLLAAALISLPWLHYIYALPATPSVVYEPDPKWVDALFVVPMLIADLKREGLFSSEMSNVFMGDPGSLIDFLKRNRMEVVVMKYEKMGVEDCSVDFVLTADGLGEWLLGFVDRVLKVGGIVVFRLVEDPFRLYRMPVNYRMVYIRRFGSTVVAIKKISQGNLGEFKSVCVKGRKLLSFVNELKAKRLKKMVMYVRRFGSTMVSMEKTSHGNVGELKGGVRGRRLFSVVKSMDKVPSKETKEAQLKKMYAKRFRLNIVPAMRILHRNVGESKGELSGRKLLSVAKLKDKAFMAELKEKQLKKAITYMHRFWSLIMAIKNILHGNIGGFTGGLRGNMLLSVAKLMGEAPMNELKEKQQKMTMYIRRFGSTIVAIKKISYANGLRDRTLLLVVKLDGGNPTNEMEEKQLEKITVCLLKLMGDDDSSNGHLFEIDYGRKNWKFKGMNLKGKDFMVMEEMKRKEMIGYLMDEMG